MIRIEVTNRVEVSDPEGLDPGIEADIRLLCQHSNPKYQKLLRMGVPRWQLLKEPPVYQTWSPIFGEASRVIGVSVPRGNLSRVRAILTKHNAKYSVTDSRTLGKVLPRVLTGEIRRPLYPYQQSALESILERQNTVLRAPTGSGKTTVALAAIAALNIPSIVIVWSANLFEQWVARCTSELGIPPSEVGLISGSKRKIKPVTIAMQQTLVARGIDQELKDYFGAVFADEVQRFAAPTLFRAIDPWPAKYRIGVSADERRKDEKEFLIYDLFGKVGADIPREQLIESGHVLDVEILVVPTYFQAPWYDPMDWQNGFNRLLEEMQSDTDRNQLIANIVEGEVKRHGQQVMVLVHRRDHCRVLDSEVASRGIDSGYLIGGKDYEQEFAKSLAGIHAGTLKVAIGTVQAVGQALDIPSMGVAVAGTPLATNRQQFGQVRGRVCRTAKGKESARLYYLWDRYVHGLSHLKNLIKWNDTVRVMDGNEWVDAKSFVKDQE